MSLAKLTANSIYRRRIYATNENVERVPGNPNNSSKIPRFPLLVVARLKLFVSAAAPSNDKPNTPKSFCRRDATRKHSPSSPLRRRRRHRGVHRDDPRRRARRSERFSARLLRAEARIGHRRDGKEREQKGTALQCPHSRNDLHERTVVQLRPPTERDRLQTGKRSVAHKGADALRPPWRGLDSPCRQSTAHTCICPPARPVESVLVPRSAEAFPLLETVSMRHACFLAIVPPSLSRANTVLDYPSVGVRDAVTSVESSRLSTFFCHRYKNIVTN